MALALGILGIYGVISYAVSQRRREIGIRHGAGCEKERAGVDVRSLGAGAHGRWHGRGAGGGGGTDAPDESLLFGISPLDPVTFLAVPVLLVAAAALASYLPARRTAAVNPVESLRAE